MRKRHMVDISDDAWDKLERLAHRLGNAQFVYKGRPRYGKLIELAIEKLEDSTMEWTVEEVELAQDEWYDDGPLPIDEHYTETAEEWWLANPITPVQAGQAEQDMALYGNAYIGVDYAPGHDSTVTLKPIKASSVSFENIAYAAGKASESTEKLAASFKLQDQIAQGFVENLGKKMSDALLDGVTSAIAGKPKTANDPNVKTHSKVSTTTHENGSIVVILTCDLTQALSAKQQNELRGYVWKAAAKYVSKGLAPTQCYMKNIPWNKLYIDFLYAPETTLLTELNVVAHNLCLALENWLLQGNFIGPLPQAVDITEEPVKNVSCQHKIEKAIDKNGTLQEYDTYNIKVSLTPFDAIALNDNKHEIADRLKVLLLSGHGYPIHGAITSARILWDDDHDGDIRISASILRKLSSPFKGYSQEFVSQATKYLENIVNAIQHHKSIKSESYKPPIW